jgi:uncharacterized protein (TIGR02594 family)
MQYNALMCAQQYLGLKEVAGQVNNPAIMAMLRLDQQWPTGDETPWCSAFVNWICFQIGLKRTKDLRARSWLLVGEKLTIPQVDPGFDIAILQRGGGNQPGPEVIDAQGHVGFVFSMSPTSISLLGGNQGDAVTISSFPIGRLLGLRRLHP